MGGPGSGRGCRWKRRKTTVEEAVHFSVSDLVSQLFKKSVGTLSWKLADGNTAAIRFSTHDFNGLPTLKLEYRWDQREDVFIPVPIRATPTQFGGKRWWFICPLVVNGNACNRRTANLYLPPGAKYFGCRICHGLTYRSSQNAHEEERLYAQISRRFTNSSAIFEGTTTTG